MKKIFNLLALLLLTINVAHASSQVTGFSVLNNWLQGGKIKVYDGGPTEFIANISASRGINGSGYESVEMEVVFYINSSGVQHDLKTITLTTSHFNGLYLAYYNEEPGSPTAANNNVVVAIPANINHGRVGIKYRWKDSSGNWQPMTNTGIQYNNLNNYGYDTINLTPPPITYGRVPIYVYNRVGGSDHYFTPDNKPKIGNGNFVNEGIAFYAFNIQEPGTVPIYVHYNSSQTDHYFTPNSQQVIASGFVNEGIAFYAYPSPNTNTVPIYSHYHAANKDHYFTPNTQAVIAPGFVREGIEFYGVN